MKRLDEMIEKLRPDSGTVHSLSAWSLAGLWARFRRLCHGLKHLALLLKNPSQAEVHCDLDACDDQNRLLVMGCTCGKVFWHRSLKKESVRYEADRPGDTASDSDGLDSDRPSG